MTAQGFLDLCLWIGFALIVASLALGLLRLSRGPTFSDRVVALDMMNVSIVTFCALDAIRTGSTAFLDVAIVLALIGFLATVALARFAERGLHRRTDRTPPPNVKIARQAAPSSHTPQEEPNP